MTDFDIVRWWLPDFPDDWDFSVETDAPGDPRQALARIEAGAPSWWHKREHELEDEIQRLRRIEEAARHLISVAPGSPSANLYRALGELRTALEEER